MEEINLVIEDLEMLKNGSWVPDEHSCNACIEMLEIAKTKFDKMYSEEDMEKAFTNGLNRSFDSDFDRWFKQFKKK